MVSTFPSLWLAFREGFRVALSKESRQRVWHMPLYENSIFLMLNSAIGTLLGLVFWVVTSGFYLPGIVGRGKAVVSMAGFLAFAASLGLGISIIRFLPVAGTNVAALISLCFTISGFAVVVAVVVFLVRLPVWSPVKIKGMAGMEEG